LDIDGHGYDLTDAKDGVWFDFWGNGEKVRMSWTARNSTNAFLVLDRNGNGKIDDGAELFGNLTPQPQCAGGRNGWNALTVFDSNGDGIIDAKDEIWSRLRLWQDLNHNGISEPNELHTLPELGVTGLSLTYVYTPFIDRWGNNFRYKARVYGEGSGQVAYDVFFTIIK
jgi:hypothetical protein